MNGIGTYKERSLHSTLKLTLEPDRQYHEVKYKGFIADIKRGDSITEIQTRSFNALRRKLDIFLAENTVTVVYPIARVKWLIWVDTETGETTKKRRSPKLGKPYEIFPELYKIKPYIKNPNLRLKIIMTDIEEYRSLTGWSADKKKGSTRYERIPVGFGETVEINSFDDYVKLLPPGLPETFTSKDFAKLSGLSQGKAQTALNILFFTGTVIRCGKSGNSYIYSTSEIKKDL